MTAIENRGKRHLVFVEGFVEKPCNVLVADVPDACIRVPGDNGLILLVGLVGKRVLYLGPMPGIEEKQHITVVCFSNKVFAYGADYRLVGGLLVLKHMDVLARETKGVEQHIPHAFTVVHC